MKDKVDSFVSMANIGFEENTSSLEDDNRVDRDPPKWEHIKVSVPLKGTKEEHIPKFDHDDGYWITDMRRRKREVSEQIFKVALTALYHALIMILTCGATEAELTYGYERYPLFTAKYSKKGTGKYKHYMRVNKDDLYQISGTEVDRPPDNYTFAPNVKYVNGGKTKVLKDGNTSKVSPGEAASEEPSERSTLVPRPSDHDIADPHLVGGLKGNGQKHGRVRPKQTMKFFEEVRVIIFQTDLDHRRKESLWVTNDLIVKNKADHKEEKQKMMKLKERDKDLKANLETVNEDGEIEEKKPVKDAPKRIPIHERVKAANKAHRKELKANPLPKERYNPGGR
mmetsp:Transcript_26143/g.49439  ORF Transcript_26143/g.49439 Transcript_26143/m.49439 type:complete len:339 (+) Transcript_26143:240-1256(+)|eukprot:CAMPEP_0182491492 /NCGR_PEP_ID=MMETSP1321-20130603/910_1 /TAXON_ID=91990 /ORGANISM="Bolidomonas sp., Strain RCC1657" /LENGTH=338 /DNA_ID=CAMNT_0024693773 /DNA_START=174 /DNA_END=1190 /DNA_ORIENTATION=-